MNKKILVFIATVSFLGTVLAKPSDDIVGSEEGSGSCSCPVHTPQICPRVTPMRCEIKTPTRTATRTVTRTPTRTVTRTATRTATKTATPTKTVTKTPTRTATRTVTKTPTRTPTRTATRTVTPTPTPQCKTYSIENVYKGVAMNDGRINFSGESLPLCLKQNLDEKISKCKKFAARGKFYKHFSSCMLVELAGYDAYSQWGTFWGNVSNWYDYGKAKHYREPYYYKVNSKGECVRLNKPEGKICEVAELEWYISPISLVFEGAVDDIDRESKIVKFALKPGGDQFSNWKASKSAPLLVFDPEHTGKIVDSTQLFGNWTFGGKASVKNSAEAIYSDSGLAPVAWDNGYEALGSLDGNGDGKISEVELSSLALWYDVNQNAVAEEGEVKSIVDEGITALYYKDAQVNNLTNDVVVSHGYDRMVSGVMKHGVSVDWYGLTADSDIALLQKKSVLGQFCDFESHVSGLFSGDNLQLPSSDYASVSNSSLDPYLGAWSWRSNTGEKSLGGMLIFSSEQEGPIRGMSFVEMEMGDGGNQDRAILAVPLLGTALEEDQKSPKFKFSYQDSDGTVVENIASLSDDLNTLSGNTTVYRETNGKKVINSEYSWKATKIKVED